MKAKKGKLLDYFPKGYKPRPQQVYILNEAEKYINAGVKYIIINAPTGIGKSLIAMTIGNYFDSCYVCTAQKSLQEQYMNDFKHLATTAKGRANFECLEYDHKRDGNINDCDHGWCTRNKDPEKTCKRSITNKKVCDEACESYTRGTLYYQSEEEPCGYHEQKANALRSQIVVANYDYLLAAINYTGDFGQRDVLISDEGHGLEGRIANFVTVDISQYLLDRLNDYIPQRLTFPFTSYKDPQETKFKKHLSYLSTIRIALKIAEKQESKRNGDIKMFGNAINKIELLLDDVDKNKPNWVVKEERKDWKGPITKIQFCPVFVHQYAKEKYFCNGEINIIMSATILADTKATCVQFAKDLGIKENEFEFITVPQVFPPINNLIYNLQLANLRYVKDRSQKEEEEFNKQLVKKIDLLLDLHPKAKGIIHCHTKYISKFIGDYTRHKDRIITHDTKNRMDKLAEHCDSNKPTVLCSPSMHEGVDLKDDLSRFQIIVKIQYPNTKEERMERRSKIDVNYIDRQAALAFAQALGRSVRSKDDYARTYTIDSRFTWFISKNQNYLGNILKDRIVSKNLVEDNLRDCYTSKKEKKILDELLKPIN